jgi:hypothetical protein
MEVLNRLNQEYDEFVALKKPSFELMDDGTYRCVCEYDKKDFEKTYVKMRTGLSDARYYSVTVYENYQQVDYLYTYDEQQAIKFAYLYAHKQFTGESYGDA